MNNSSKQNSIDLNKLSSQLHFKTPLATFNIAKKWSK